ncbi:hypothetical protein DL93DRAFT_1226387 [Clavulina sp. PMI_390]|nr:hypothetical protein DL93DRAFT_1226387 [Clavulina sp. PMI_390]
MIFHLGFAMGVWSKSATITAPFGIPVGAVSSAALLAVLHVYPAALATPLWKLPTNSTNTSSTANARIFVDRDVTTMSCHDGPLEIELAERLERQFPQEEESRSYPSEVVIPDGRSDPKPTAALRSRELPPLPPPP